MADVKKDKRELLGRDNLVDLIGSGTLAAVLTKVLLKETSGVALRVGAITGLACVVAAYTQEYMVASKNSYQYSAIVGSFLIPAIFAGGVIKLTMADNQIIQKSLIAGGSCMTAAGIMRMDFTASAK